MDRILVGVDGSEHSMKAVDAAANMAATTGAALRLLAVIPAVSADELDDYARSEHLLEDLPQLLSTFEPAFLGAAADRARAKGAAKISVGTASGDPASQIVAAAGVDDVDLIVVGCRGRGRLTGLLLGSVSQKLASHAACSVLIVR